jgi:hypothetical protein
MVQLNQRRSVARQIATYEEAPSKHDSPKWGTPLYPNARKPSRHRALTACGHPACSVVRAWPKRAIIGSLAPRNGPLRTCHPIHTLCFETAVHGTFAGMDAHASAPHHGCEISHGGESVRCSGTRQGIARRRFEKNRFARNVTTASPRIPAWGASIGGRALATAHLTNATAL